MARGLSSAGCHQVTCGRSPCGWTFVRPICCRILCLGPSDGAQLWWANEVALSLCVPRPSAQYLSETITLFTDLEGSVAPYSPVAGTQAGHRGAVGGSSGLALSPGPRALPVLWALQSPGPRRGGWVQRQQLCFIIDGRSPRSLGCGPLGFVRYLPTPPTCLGPVGYVLLPACKPGSGTVCCDP